MPECNPLQDGNGSMIGNLKLVRIRIMKVMNTLMTFWKEATLDTAELWYMWCEEENGKEAALK